MSAHVSGLALTAVKGTRLQAVPAIDLETGGARGDRVFYVVDEAGRMQNGKRLGALQTVLADYDSESGRLSLGFPDGRRAEDTLDYGDPIETQFFSRRVTARPLDGPWSDALSSFAGQPLRVVAPMVSALDRGPEAAASIISRASLSRLAQEAQTETVDGRRFRMLVEVDGVGAHEEDTWMSRRLRIGEALVAVRGNVGRCVVTTRDPESGEVTLPTLRLLAGYRSNVETTEPLPFGIYAAVLEPGPVRVGDPVTVED